MALSKGPCAHLHPYPSFLCPCLHHTGPLLFYQHQGSPSPTTSYAAADIQLLETPALLSASGRKELICIHLCSTPSIHCFTQLHTLLNTQVHTFVCTPPHIYTQLQTALHLHTHTVTNTPLHARTNTHRELQTLNYIHIPLNTTSHTHTLTCCYIQTYCHNMSQYTHIPLHIQSCHTHTPTYQVTRILLHMSIHMHTHIWKPGCIHAPIHP